MRIPNRLFSHSTIPVNSTARHTSSKEQVLKINFQDVPRKNSEFDVVIPKVFVVNLSISSNGIG